MRVLPQAIHDSLAVMIANTATADLCVRGVPQWLVVGESARDLKVLVVVGITKQNNHLQIRK